MSGARAFLFGVALVACVSGGARSADPREALIDQLLNQSSMQSMASTYMAAYAKEFLRSWKSTLAPMDEATEKALLSELTKRLASDDMNMVPKMRELYLKLFTKDELQAMVDFYGSPLGKSIAAKLEAFDSEFAEFYYPGISEKAIRHWYDAVYAMRAAGQKL